MGVCRRVYIIVHCLTDLFFFTYPIEIYATYRAGNKQTTGVLFTLQNILLKGIQPSAIGQFVLVDA